MKILGISKKNIAAVCGFIMSMLAAAQVYSFDVVEELNAARVDPQAWVLALDGETGALEAFSRELSTILRCPLVFNESLSAAAAMQARDMLDGVFWGHEGLDGSTYQDRIAMQGYHALLSAESIVGIAMPESMLLPYDYAVRSMAESIIKNGMEGGANWAPLFDPQLTEVGYAVEGAPLELGGVNYNVYVMVVVIARPAPDVPCILGHVFRDINGDDSYEAGEGLGNVVLLVDGPWTPGFDPAYRPEVESFMVSGGDGAFVAPVSKTGWYRVQFQGSDGAIRSVEFFVRDITEVAIRY